jgi:thiamine pyrophosphokinase
MSSHHTVREKQEPTILVADGIIPWNSLFELLEWSPTVVALDGAARRLMEQGIKVDWVIGDLDTEKEVTDLLSLQPDVRIIHLEDQDCNDLEKGLKYLVEDGHSACHILGASGDRSDHWLENLSVCMKFSNQINWQWIGTHDRMYPIPQPFKKYFEKGVGLGLLPFPEVLGVSATNLVWPVEDLDLRLGVRTGSSNRVAENGWVEISYRSGQVLLVEYWE